MQNIQDVENSKKILPQRDEMMSTTIETNLDLGLERYRNIDVDDDESTDLTKEKDNNNQTFDEDNLDLIMEEYEIQESQNGLSNSLTKENDVGNLSKEMKEHYIIDDPINTDAVVTLSESEYVLETESLVENEYPSHNSSNTTSDIVKVI